MATAEPSDTPQGVVALAFARALVSGDFANAHKMLATSLQTTTSAEQLKAVYDLMIEDGDGPPDFIGVMEAWNDSPTKQPGDIGCAYVAISGTGYGEAVSVVVARENGRLVVRSIVWGRP